MGCLTRSWDVGLYPMKRTDRSSTAATRRAKLSAKLRHCGHGRGVNKHHARSCWNRQGLLTEQVQSQTVATPRCFLRGGSDVPHWPHAGYGLRKVSGPNADKLVHILLVDCGLIFEEVGASRMPSAEGYHVGGFLRPPDFSPHPRLSPEVGVSASCRGD